MIPAVLLALLPLALGKDHIQRSNKHHARNLEGSMELSGDLIEARLNSWGNSTDGLQKRGDSGRATFYDVGLGACGEYNSDSDFVVALNQGQYGSSNSVSKYCFKYINIQYGGKSAKAQIVDCCPGCPWGALDMSPALFKHFANPDMGVFYMTWGLVGDDSGGDGGDDSQTTSKKTSQWTPTTSSQWKPDPTTTSQWVATTTSSSSVSSSYSNYTNATSTFSGNSTASATTSLNTTATGLPNLPAEDFDYEGGVLFAVNQVALGFTGLSGAILNERAAAITEQ
ncbi:hypothetical protein BT69DRAFT_1320455 [Atractiella rhizophila]|nr:hypothetical protein BT69DRAFT_1320455 [Atractiella rhizophila]